MKYLYTAYSKEGAKKTGSVEAQDKKEAEQKLRKRDLIVTRVDPEHATDPAGGAASTRASKKTRISVKALADFAREFGVLVATGTPIVDSIASLERQNRGETLEPVIAALRERLEQGESLAEAMNAQRKVFGQVFCALVAAGEAGGNLDRMLRRVADLLRQEAKIRANVMGAMLYPILLTSVSIIVLGLMIGVVLPRFSTLFASLDTELPMSTQALMTLSAFLRASWWILLPAFLSLVGVLVVWIRSDAGRTHAEAFTLRAPVLGRIVRSLETARLFRVLGLLIESRVPIIEAIALTRRSVVSHAYAELLSRAEDAVTIGEPVSDALGEGRLIVPSALEAVRNAERSGSMGEAMLQLADYLDEENETVIKSISSIIEPLIMIVLGVLVGLVAISMFLPLFDLTASAGAR